SPGATTPSARMPAACAISSAPSGTSGRASSGTRSAAASRCSSPTSSPSAANGSCSSRAAGSGGGALPSSARRRPPGGGGALPLLCAAGVRDAVDGVARGLARLGLRAAPDLEEMWRGFCSLADADARLAFVHTLRTIIDPGGQRVSAADRLYLAAEVPVLLVWGEQDPMIPVAHARMAHQVIPGSRLAIFPAAGHFPHRAA